MRQSETGSARDLIDAAVTALDRAGVANPRLDAELILAESVGRTRIDVMFGDVEIGESARSRFATMLNRRTQREPLAYIIGRKEFYSLELEVTPAVLIPRPDTETVVAAALEFLAHRKRACVLDLGVGSGAIALAIAANAPHTKIVASDASAAALAVARRNAERLGLRGRITFRDADCFDPIDGAGLLGRFDLVVSNPPYIREGEIAALQPEVRLWEPRLALAGGPDGLSFYRRIATRIAAHLEADGCGIFEIGEGQADAVARVLTDAEFGAITMFRDLTGAPRAIGARRC